MQVNSNDKVLGLEQPQDEKTREQNTKWRAGKHVSRHLEQVADEEAQEGVAREREKSGPDVIVYSDSHGSPENSHPGE